MNDRAHANCINNKCKYIIKKYIFIWAKLVKLNYIYIYIYKYIY